MPPTQTMIRLGRLHRERLERLARADGTTLSDQVRRLIDAERERRRERRNPTARGK